MLKQIKNYELLRQIGTGGFGEVYVARQKVINREVAVKVIQPLYANREDFIKKFQFEAELVAKLEHPHIVPLFDYWRDPTGAYLVMRYIKGGNLADYLLAHGALDLQSAARLLTQIAGALHTAHRNRVIHQDIKPANILLDEDGNAYLTDFGIAHDIDSNINLAQDESNTMHGSPKYISPEHLRRRKITARSDMYSLGILMYEAITGQAPFEHDDMLQLLQMHVRNDLPSVQQKKPELPEALNYPLQQATLKDPLARYESVVQFAQDFQVVVNNLSEDRTSPIPLPSSLAIEDTGPIEIRNPYKGLSAFKESDAEDFYGRETLINSLIESLRTDGTEGRFLAIVGASGSGKSSVVRAGLIPAVRNESIEGLPPLYITTMIPGQDPMRSLEAAILKVASRASVSLMQTISTNDYDLNDVLRNSLPKDGEMLLLLDQFEEIFTLINDEQKRTQFLDHIYDALTAEDSCLRVIATLRADFLHHPIRYPNWGALFRARMELIPAMTQAELRAAIEEPAKKSGIILEDGLSDLLISQVSAQQGNLPLLQYTLSELYERKQGIELTSNAYEEIGGISGALAKRADEIYTTLTPAERDVARMVFLRLVRIGQQQESTRQRITRTELYTLESEQSLIEKVIDTFGKYRLLTFDHDPNNRQPTVEIAHEALIRSWDLLSGWITDNKEDLLQQGRLSDASRLWVEEGKDSSYLASGMRLQQFATLDRNPVVALTKREQEYLTASILAQEELEKRNRRRKRLLDGLRAAIVVAGMIAVVLAIFAWDQRNAAIDARNDEAIARELAEDNARESRARELAASSLLYAESQPDRALLLALESLETQHTFDGQNALLSGLLTQDDLAAYFNGHNDDVRAVTLSDDGTMLATGDQSGTVIIWDTTRRTALFQMSEHTARVNTVAFHPDDNVLASAAGNGETIIWDTTSGDVQQRLTISEDEIRSLSYSPDGNQLAIANAEGQIYWLDTTDNYALLQTETAHDGGVIYDLAYHPDGQTMATAGEDNQISIWNTDDQTLNRSFPAHNDWVLALAFSPDGSQLASSSVNGTVRVWDTASGDNLWAIQAHASEVFTLTYDETGRILISGGLDDRILYLDASTGTLLGNFSTYERTGVRGLATANNQLYLVGDTPDVIEVNIRFQPRFGEMLAQTEETLGAVAYHEDGTIAFAGGEIEDYAVYVLPPDADTPLVLNFHNNTISDLVWHEDSLISVSLDRQIAIWQDNQLAHSIEVEDNLLSIAVHGNQLALGQNNGDIALWTIADNFDAWQQTDTLEGHSNRVTTLDFNSDGTQLASGSRDGAVIQWDVNTGDPIHAPFTTHTNAIEGVAFHPDGTMIASASRDQTIILWDTASGTALGPPLTRHENWVNDVEFSRDGSLMVSVSADESIILWDTDSQRVLGLPFIGHEDWVNALAFAPDSTTIATVSRDGMVIRWNVTLDAWRTTACEVANRSLTTREEREFFSLTAPANACANP